MEKAIYFSIVLVEIFPGGQEMKMHLRSSRVETVQTVEKRERERKGSEGVKGLGC